RALSWIDRLRKEKIAKLALEHQTKAEAANAERKLWKKQVEEATAANRPAPAMPASATDPGVFVAPRLYVSDATIERMAVLLQANPRGMLRLSDELSGLFLNMSRCIGPRSNSTAVSANGLRRPRPMFFAFPARCVFWTGRSRTTDRRNQNVSTKYSCRRPAA